MKQGRQEWFNPNEGYGHITLDDGIEEHFFDYSATWGSEFRNLERGERVTHKLVEGWYGAQAETVSKVSAAAVTPKAGS